MIKQLKKGLEEIEKVSGRWEEMQSKLSKDFGDDDDDDDDGDDDEYRWLQCKTDPRKTAAVFNLQVQLVKTKVWKKMRGMTDQEQCR